MFAFAAESIILMNKRLGKTITYAADAGQTEISAILMDERYSSFPKKKKKFVL